MIRIGIWLLLMLWLSPPLVGQNDEPAAGGLINATGSAGQRGSRQGSSRTQPTRTSRVTGLAKRSKYVKKRIDEMQKQSYRETKPAQSKKDSQVQIEQLKRRRDLIRGKFDKQTRETLTQISESSKMFKNKWEAVAAELGKPQQSEQKWAEREKDLFDNGDDWEFSTKLEPTTDFRKQPKDLPLSLDGADPPAEKPPSRKPAIKVPDFDDLKKAFEQQNKPAKMSTRRWIWLQDQFYRDLANLQSRIASAKRSIDERNAADLKSLDQAIAAAEATLRFLSSLGRTPSPDFRRHLAWRIHQARLRAQRALYDRLVAAEAAASEMPEKKMIEMHPMNPAETLRQMTRYMDTSSRPRAPERNALEDADLDGLPPLYPSGPEFSNNNLYDPDLHYGKLVQSRIQRGQRQLRELNREMQELEDDIRQQDAEEIERLENLLWQNDRLDGKTNNRARQRMRAQQVKEKTQELENTRSKRVDDKRQALEKRISRVKRRLSEAYGVKEYKTLDKAVQTAAEREK